MAIGQVKDQRGYPGWSAGYQRTMSNENNGHSCECFRYNVYGISLRSEIVLSLPEHTHPGLTEIEVSTGSASLFSEAIQGVDLQTRSDWYHYAYLADRSIYVRWSGLGEFLVSSDGRRITCARAPDASMESFQVYLVGQALSFALVKSGFEPLHATSIGVDGEALAILGESGFGKSSLAACFLAAGHSLLTDDLLLLQPGCGGFDAYPGPPRIKLFPDIARHFFGRAAEGVPMNSLTEKQIFPLGQCQSRPLPLRAIYALASPHETRDLRRIRIEPLSPQAAFLALVGSTFNSLLVDPERLRRQAGATACLLSALPVKKLSYPRGLGHLPSVRQAILSDLEGSRLASCGGTPLRAVLPAS